jgi:signal transduction histidine kinase
MRAAILVVDDDRALLRALPDTLRLRMEGVDVTTAASAPEALALIASADYDAIVSDIKMPGMDGIELLHEVQRLRPDTPTLLITGHGEHDLAVRALRGGAYDLIQKPIDRDYIVAALVRAITRSRLTRELERQRGLLERQARVLDQMSEGVIVLAADGRVELWNDAAAFVTGVPPEEAVGRPLEAVLPGWADAGARIEIADAPGTAPPRLVPIESEGGDLWLSCNAVRFRDAVIYTFRSTSAERGVDELKSEFLSTVSHELRTPLAVVYGAATTLAERDPGGERREQLLAVLLQEAARLRQLVEDLLTASALDGDRLALSVEPLDPIAFVRTVVDTLRVGAPAGATIDLELPATARPLRADPEKLRQVLINLIENALKHTPAGTPVTVGVEERDSAIRVFVRDRGPGVPPAEQRRIFEKFYRADPLGGSAGSGLGLYISRELVKLMEGRITVVSAPHEGATFAVDLPVAAAAERRPAGVGELLHR